MLRKGGAEAVVIGIRILISFPHHKCMCPAGLSLHVPSSVADLTSIALVMHLLIITCAQVYLLMLLTWFSLLSFYLLVNACAQVYSIFVPSYVADLVFIALCELICSWLHVRRFIPFFVPNCVADSTSPMLLIFVFAHKCACAQLESLRRELDNVQSRITEAQVQIREKEAHMKWVIC
jgi:hypothetical protein